MYSDFVREFKSVFEIQIEIRRTTGASFSSGFDVSHSRAVAHVIYFSRLPTHVIDGDTHVHARVTTDRQFFRTSDRRINTAAGHAHAKGRYTVEPRERYRTLYYWTVRENGSPPVPFDIQKTLLFLLEISKNCSEYISGINKHFA